jgi:hypothetical protein
VNELFEVMALSRLLQDKPLPMAQKRWSRTTFTTRMIVALQKQRALDRRRGNEQALAPDREIQTRFENDCVA